MFHTLTLLRLDPNLDVNRLVEAANCRGVPLAVVDVDADEAPTLYTRKLTLVRPDQHIAWRGDRLPDDPLALIERIRGALIKEQCQQEQQA